MNLDPHLICSLAQTNPLAATVQLIDGFHERIYAFLRRLAGNDSDAEDLTQQTFIRVQRSLPSFAAKSSVSSWLHGIAYHVYVDWQRKHRPTEARSSEWWAECSAADPPPDQVTVKSDLSQEVFRGVDELAPELRDAVHLHYYQGLTLEETGSAMNIASSTVKYRLRQAVAELQKRFAMDRSIITNAFTQNL